MDRPRLARNTRVKERMDKYQFDLNICYEFYFDQFGNPANYTPPETTAPPKSTETAPRNSDHSSEGFWSLYLVPVIAGIAAFVVLACCITVCCLCAARKERKKRKEIEGEYKIVASTLTNITDSEDGCTYETLSMNMGDPTYNHGLKLPTRKPKGKIKGVTNPFSAMRRLLSEDGESTGSTDTTITYTTDYKRSTPLPAIPEALNNKETVKAIDEYTEIGSGSIKSRNEYHHLNSSCRAKQKDYIDSNPYDALRQSQILKYESEAKAGGEYFVLESNDKNAGNVTEAPATNQGDGYFCLEKVNRVNSGSGLCKTDSQGVIVPSDSVRALENNLNPNNEMENNLNSNGEKKSESEPRMVTKDQVVSEHLEPIGLKTNIKPAEEPNRLSNTYFTLAKENDSNVQPTKTASPSNEYLDLETPAAGNSNRASYLEASEIQKHNYIDLVADFTHGKNPKGTGSVHTYAAVKK